MGLRPGRVVRRIERPWTRVSKHVPRKSYVKGVPFPKTHQFEMGNRLGSFDTNMYLVGERNVQIRDNAVEAARIVATKFLETKLTTPNYFMKILVYPHHVLREKPIATGAGADRYSQGMAHPFGKPSGTAVQMKSGQRILQLRVSRANLDVAKKALKKFSLKISTPSKIVIEE